MHLTRPALTALVVASLVGLAACTGDDGSEPRSTPTGTPASPLPTLAPVEPPGTGKDADAQGPVAVPEDAAGGGTVTVLAADVPFTFDPTRAYFHQSTAILNLVTRGLTQYAFDPVTESMVLVPDMATDLGRHNEDYTEWTFTLREGLRYEDGTEVKAEDVAYAISRSFAIEELPDGPTYQLQFFLDGGTYLGPYKEKAPYRGVEVNGNDITIRMSRPFVDMDYYASFPMFTGIPEGKDTKERYGDHPLATGPYMFEEYKRGRFLTLVKNPEWDPSTDPGRVQSVDEWVFEFGQAADETAHTMLSHREEARTAITYDPMTRATFDRMMKKASGRLVVGTSPCTYLWYLDMRKITDIRVRRAIGYAYPYESAWQAAGEIVGVTRIPGTNILPPGTVGRGEYDALGIQGYDTDPTMSKRLLREAGAMGFEIKLHHEPGDPVTDAVMDTVTKALERGGFEVVPIPGVSKIREAPRSEYDRPINVRSSGWCSDWPTGGSWFPAQWDGSLVGQEGMPNLSNFQEADADQVLHDILDGKVTDTAIAWGELDELIEKTYYPAVNLGYSGVAFIRGGDIGGMYVDNVRGMPTFQTMYVTG